MPPRCDFFISKGLKYDTVAYIKHLSFTEWHEAYPLPVLQTCFFTVLGDNQMNKKLLAVAVAAFVAAPAIATADTTLFGQFKYEVGYIDDGNDSNLVHSSIGSRLGVRGSEDLGGGLKAIFRFTSNFSRTSADGSKLSGTSFKLNEDNYVGLQGGFGQIALGRKNTAVKLASAPFRNFEDVLADGNNRPRGWQRADGIHYTTPSFGGLTIGATIEPNGVETDSYWALNAIYKAGPLFVSAAVEGSPDDNPTYAVGDIGVDQTNWQLGASYNWDPITIGLLYQLREESFGGDDLDVWTLPISFKVTPNVNLRAAVQHNDPENGDDWTNYALGVQYNFSKRTELFANVWDDDIAGVTPGGADETHFGVGLRHSF